MSKTRSAERWRNELDGSALERARSVLGRFAIPFQILDGLD
jgi:hypothetical protein